MQHLSLSLSPSLSIFIHLYPSLSISLPLSLPTSLPLSLSTCLPLYLSTSISIYLSVCLSIYLPTSRIWIWGGYQLFSNHSIKDSLQIWTFSAKYLSFSLLARCFGHFWYHYRRNRLRRGDSSSLMCLSATWCDFSVSPRWHGYDVPVPAWCDLSTVLVYIYNIHCIYTVYLYRYSEPIYLSIYVYVCINTHVYIYIFVHTHVYIYIYL